MTVPPGEPALSLERIEVGAGRLSCVVRLAPDAPRFTTPKLAARLREAFPDLPRHACVNEVGPCFGDVMDRTPLPHALEHLVIDLQTRAAPHDAAVYAGTTDWVDEAAGTARVQVSFTDDLAALRAFRDATRFLSDCVVGLRDIPTEEEGVQDDVRPSHIRQNGR